MKRRLLTVLLVAFVLCTMAINSFALTNPDTGLPVVLDYSAAYKAYPQYNSVNYPGYTARIYIRGQCPYCGGDVTYVNYIIDREKLDVVKNSSKKSFIVGIYQTYPSPSFPKSNFAFSNVVFDTECPYKNSNNFYNYWEQGAVFTWYAGTYDTPSNIMIHRYEIDTDILDATESYGWYASFFTYDNNISKQITDVAAYLFSNLQTTGNYESYYNRTSDFILRCFLSSPYDDYFVSDYTYESSYKEGFDAGVLQGQNMFNWTFLDLFDGLFSGFAEFTEPFLSIGFGGFNIGTLLGLVGVFYTIMLIVRIVRG